MYNIVTETKHRKTRTAQIKTWVFATSNSLDKIMIPLQSRFFAVLLLIASLTFVTVLFNLKRAVPILLILYRHYLY
jgi:hypothetical protein